MGKYRRRSVEVDAFCFGFEPQPQWFIDMTMNGTEAEGISAFRVKSTGRLLKVRDGDYFIYCQNNLWVCEGNMFPVLYMVSVNLEPEYSEVDTEEITSDAIVNAGVWAIIGFGVLSIGIGYLFGAGAGWVTAGIGCIGVANLMILHARQIARRR